jgi:heme exporter protein C
VPNVVIVNRSVEWWRSLHQEPTITRLDPQIDGDLLVALMCGFLAMTLVFIWLMVHRFRVGWLEYQAERLDLDEALAARRAEAAESRSTDATSGTSAAGSSTAGTSGASA